MSCAHARLAVLLIRVGGACGPPPPPRRAAARRALPRGEWWAQLLPRTPGRASRAADARAQVGSEADTRRAPGGCTERLVAAGQTCRLGCGLLAHQARARR
jgi:hypothetical protein